MAGIADSDYEETAVLLESNSNNPQHISRSQPADDDSDLVSVSSSDPNSSWKETVHSDHLSNSDLNVAVKRLTLTGVKIHDKELGQGATGIVYKADYNGIPCAAKRVQPIRLRYLYTEGNRYFLQECLLHSKLKHENVVKMLGVSYDATDQSNLNLFLVMEQMKYTLAQLINELFIPMYVKLSILEDVSAGLRYLHSRDIVHCGIDPVNILLTVDLVAKIGDFGDAKLNKVGLYTARGDTAWGQRSWDGISSTSDDVAHFGKVACNLIAQSQHIFKVKKYEAIMRPIPSIQLSTISRIGDYDIRHFRSRLGGNYRLPRSLLDDFLDNTVYKISEGPLRKLVESCLNYKSFLRPTISVVHETIIDIKKGYSNDASVKIAYSLALRKGEAELKDLQVQLVGAENTGKTSLISSFLNEEFVEERTATTGADVEVCKISSKNWTMFSKHDKTFYYKNMFVQFLRISALNNMIKQNLVDPKPKSSNQKSGASLISATMKHETCSAGVVGPLVTDNTVDEIQKESSQDEKGIQTPMEHDVIAILWDFAGQVIFHNSHSLFISDNGVIMITFNASMELKEEVVPHEGSPQPPECHTMISSIHYWLQVINSLCSVKENVLLVGTHIDKLHDDIDKAREIAKGRILPQLFDELYSKPYVWHLAGLHVAGLARFRLYDNLKNALKNCCFFISNKIRDKEIEHLKARAIEVSTALQKKQPIYFLKIEQALMQQTEPIISKSTMLDLVTKNTFLITESSPEFEGTLRYFHNKRTILHFSEIESLKEIVILSPHWLAKLIGYVLTADTFEMVRNADINKASERLHKYGILQENLLQHMLDKFYSDYPAVVKVTKQQVVDILLCFHLLACITNTWFSEEGILSLPDHGDTFIVPCLLPQNDDKSVPNTKTERIVYFTFTNGFVPTSLLNQLIAECVRRNVERNNRLLWMRYGKVGLQLGDHQKYYINRCEEKQSIQLTITVVGNGKNSIHERNKLIDDISQQLDNIMKLFMPAVDNRPTVMFPCPLCSTLHITLEEVHNGSTIFCPNARNDTAVPPEHFGYLLSTKLVSHPGCGLPGREVLAQRPDMHLLNKIVVPRIEADWKDVAYSMGYEYNVVKAIEKGSHYQIKECAQNLFVEWLKKRDPTWEALLKYIKDVDDLVAAAEKIEEELVSGKQS